MAFGPGDPIEVPVDRCVAVLIGAPFMNKIWGLDIGRQFFHIRFFVFKSHRRDQAGFAGRPIGRSTGRPIKGLTIHVLKTIKTTSWEKTGLNRIKPPFIAGFAVSMAFFMTDKCKPVLSRETLHFRQNDGIGATAPQTGQIRVVDNAIFGIVTNLKIKVLRGSFFCKGGICSFCRENS